MSRIRSSVGIASGVEASLTGAGYSLILANSGNTVARERDLVRVLVEKQIDGMIVASSASAGDHILAAQERGVAVILVDSEIPSLSADSVVIDNRAAAHDGGPAAWLNAATAGSAS